MAKKQVKFTKEERKLIREIRSLIKNNTFAVKLWDDRILLVTAAWKSDTSVSIEKVTLEVRNRERCIEWDELQNTLKEMERRIGFVCNMADAYADSKKADRVEFFETLLAEAERQPYLR